MQLAVDARVQVAGRNEMILILWAEGAHPGACFSVDDAQLRRGCD